MRTQHLVLPLLLTLGACSSAPGPASYVSRVDTAPETMPVTGPDASLMMAQMPSPGGLVVNVREKTYPNGVMQQAILEGGAAAGMGENHLEISVQTGPGAGGAGMLAISRPSQDGIRREIIARYPKVEMRIVTQPRQNALGVFGLAIGRASGGARCIFAWQWVDDIRRGGAAGNSGISILGARFGGGASEGGVPASIRVHMCRKDATVDDLAATVEGLTLAAPSVIAQALDPSRRVASTVPARAEGRSTVVASAAPEGSLESALGPTRLASSAPAPAKKTTVARRKPTQPAGEAVVARTPPVIEQPQQQAVYSGGPRYMAPVAGQAAAAPIVYGNPAPVAAMAPATRQLDPSLPAAAYRGPVNRGY